jgi:23S rRNA pseudouridine1911/1915/1917 synthase
MAEPRTRFVVGAREGGKRLDQFLHERIPGLSRTRIQRTIRERVSLSWGVRARAATPVRAGGEVVIAYTPPPETPLEVTLAVLARGAGWIAVDKPPTLPVHPVNTIRENSLIRILRRQEGSAGLRLVHRLDRETSGVLLVASDPATSSRLATAFLRGAVHKEYLALVRGVLAADEGTIDRAVGPDPASPIRVKQAVDTGRPASTRFRVEARYADRTLVRLFPSTGRRHQLRVHLEALGHPILGDLLYGRPAADYLRLVAGEGDVRRETGEPQRQLLHCARLVFPAAPPALGTDPHPCVVESPLPADFRTV